eukprot:s2379_g6.t1
MAAAAAKQIMSVTKSAASRLGTLMARHSDPNTIGVRVGLRQRGCNGMSYTMDLDYTDKVNKFDEVVEADGGIKVVVDSKAVMLATSSCLTIPTRSQSAAAGRALMFEVGLAA